MRLRRRRKRSSWQPPPRPPLFASAPIPPDNVGWTCDECGALWLNRGSHAGPMQPGPYTEHTGCRHPKLRSITHPAALAFVMGD